MGERPSLMLKALSLILKKKKINPKTEKQKSKISYIKWSLNMQLFLGIERKTSIKSLSNIIDIDRQTFSWTKINE